MYGRDKAMASKKEYAGIIPERMKDNPMVNVGLPKIKLTGEKAVASTSIPRQIDAGYVRICQNGRPVARDKVCVLTKIAFPPAVHCRPFVAVSVRLYQFH